MKNQRTHFFQRIYSLLIKKIKREREFKNNIRELRNMDDRQLLDIGLSRVDLEQILSDSGYRDNTIKDRWVGTAFSGPETI